MCYTYETRRNCFYTQRVHKLNSLQTLIAFQITSQNLSGLLWKNIVQFVTVLNNNKLIHEQNHLIN